MAGRTDTPYPMKQKPLVKISALLLLILCACSPLAGGTETPAPPQEGVVLLSEIMAGKEGNNNYEFVELYNTGETVIDLRGYSLIYRLPSSEEDIPFYRWESTALIPPQGHYLLIRRNQEIGLSADAYFNQGLNTSGGGLALRNASGEIVDKVSWGNAPAAFIERSPAPELINDHSLERKPGGEAGHAESRGDHSADFSLRGTPFPQNVASPPVPATGERLLISLEGPVEVAPGSTTEYRLVLENRTPTTLQDLQIALPVPGEYVVDPIPENAALTRDGLRWELDELAPAGVFQASISVQVPWMYSTAEFSNYRSFTDDGRIFAIGEALRTDIIGGTIPIAAARALVGSDVVSEGIATMYTGGFFAGSSGTKFYIEDGTGGLQVYVPGGAGVLDVPVGARVRVEGLIDLYRGAVELIPDVPEAVEVISPPDPEQPPEPLPVDLRQAVYDDEMLPGRLIQVEGTAARVEEFNYSYEIDLIDDRGERLTLYIDKLTDFSPEWVEPGKVYKARGILEVRDSELVLNPRFEADLIPVRPPELMVEAEAPSSIPPGTAFTVRLTARNFSPTSQSNVSVRAAMPATSIVSTVSRGDAVIEGDELIWPLPDLAPGESASIAYVLRAGLDEGEYANPDISIAADEWGTASIAEPLRVFIGDSVPIWAVQGSGTSSPYKLQQVATEGVVTGVFPELGGFWIQESSANSDPPASSGLFIHTGDAPVRVRARDRVRITGTVRELSDQTALEIISPLEIEVLQSGRPLPTPVALDPPAGEVESHAYYEALEGMLVTVDQPATAVSPTSSYGEYSLVLSRHGRSRIWRGDDLGIMINVDDGSMIQYYDRSLLPYVVYTGDSVSQVQGPLAYTFGRYKIEPTGIPEVRSLERGALDAVLLDPGQFSLMTWNVENLFDILDPHPSDPPRPRKADYELALAKIANTILAAGSPTIIGLQEVENIQVMEDLAGHDLLRGYAYVPILIEGTDSRGIDVGYLVRGDTAQVSAVAQRDAPGGIFSRPPLLASVELREIPAAGTIHVLNNHFTSLAGGEQATEPRRNAQASWNVKILEEIRSSDPGASVAVIGDLNSFYDSPPLDVLRGAGMRHVYEKLPPGERYSYIFEGVSQTLDHILLTPELMEILDRVVILHVNADYPPPLPGDESPFRKSDHDPVIAIFDADH